MQSSENIIPMVGRRITRGPGGKRCNCCSAPPKYKKAEKRMFKRSGSKKIWN